MALRIQKGPNWSVRISAGCTSKVHRLLCANYPSPLVHRQVQKTGGLARGGSAAHLPQAPGIYIGLELVRVGEIEAVIASIDINPVDNVAAVAFRNHRLQPSGIVRCIGVWL